MWQKIYLLILCVFNVPHGPRCRLNSRVDFGQPLPLVLRNGQLLEPTDASGDVVLENGEALTLICDGAGFISHPNTLREMTSAVVTCEAEDLFKNDEWLSAPSSFRHFYCMYPPNYTSFRTNRTCFEGNSVYEVGYRVGSEFHPTYESCFNDVGFNVIYSKYSQKPYNAKYQTRVERPFFIADDVYRFVPVDSLFSPRGQKAAVAQLVGDKIDTYITKSDFLSRGHLAAKTDFVFAFGQRSTFHYVNCAPQWYGFNSGNWNSLEVDLRNHINSLRYDTVIYTGTFGVSRLSNQVGRTVDIYLYSDENNNPVLPVPLYFYKVVYSPTLQRGTAFVGVNNPYYTQAEYRELQFCEDRCRSRNFSWLTWQPDSATLGYSFCCTIPDFRNTIKHLPHFETESLLF